MTSFRRIVRRDSWWAILSVLTAVAMGIWIGYWGVWVGYAVFNATGLILYIDGLDVRRPGIRRRIRILQLLAVLLLPVGVVGLLLSDGPGSPGSHAAGDRSVRSDAAAASAHGQRTGTGGTY